MTRDHNLYRAARSLADTLAERRPQQAVSVVNGQVKQVTVGGGGDGGDLVTVTLSGVDVQMVHLGPTPAVGAVVTVLIAGGSPRCLGTPTGTPPLGGT